MLTGRLSLEEFLINERKRHKHASGDLNSLIFAAARACKVIANQVAAGNLSTHTIEGVEKASAEPLAAIAERIFLRLIQSSGRLAGILSPQGLHDTRSGDEGEPGKYLFVFDPLEGAANLTFNVPAGSVFSILRAPENASGDAAEFLQPGRSQVCAGYAIYGPSTMLVLTVGTGTHGFTLDPIIGEFVLTHPMLEITRKTRDFAVNAVNNRFWDAAVKRYVDECIAGESGVRGSDFNMRWAESLVAETHNILLRGGVFLNPMDTADAPRECQTRLVYGANPVAMLVEQAGGAASTGRTPILDVIPKMPEQSVGLIFGAADEVERIEEYHEDTSTQYNAPLFGVRGLFRD